MDFLDAVDCRFRTYPSNPHTFHHERLSHKNLVVRNEKTKRELK